MLLTLSEPMKHDPQQKDKVNQRGIIQHSVLEFECPSQLTVAVGKGSNTAPRKKIRSEVSEAVQPKQLPGAQIYR
jgi:hypothetical protein